MLLDNKGLSFVSLNNNENYRNILTHPFDFDKLFLNNKFDDEKSKMGSLFQRESALGGSRCSVPFRRSSLRCKAESSKL